MTIRTRLATVTALGFAAALILGACGGGGGGDGEASGATKQAGVADDSGPSTALRVEAHEFSLSPENLRAAAGTVAIEYVNAGTTVHTLLIEGVPGLNLDVPTKGDVDTGRVELEPGTYTLYCDIAGHRQAGMEAPLTVS